MHTAIETLLLTRRGVAFVSSTGTPLSEKRVRAVEMELAEVGYMPSTRLRSRLATCSLEELAAFKTWACRTLLAHVGGDRKHVPLFRKFPHKIPEDTLKLWWTKVLAHFLQAEDQPCLFCGRTGTTHVLKPCCHVVCDHCFDGANYSACPVCEHRVDLSSPFFKEVPEHGKPSEQVKFKLLDLGENLQDETKALFTSLCERTQALSDDDRNALKLILEEHGTSVLDWLPEAIPVRENIAFIFGTLFRKCPPGEVLPHAKRHMTTATDVLRFISVFSGCDGSLMPETVFKQVTRKNDPDGFWARLTSKLGVAPNWPLNRGVTVGVLVKRFKVARMSRALRRTLLGVLEGLHPDRLCEDMLRHRSFWGWVGEFLHPGEYEKRFPNAARAFRIIRKKAPDKTPAPAFRTWYSKVEKKAAERDAGGMVEILTERPGEFARRLDHTLRVAAASGKRTDRVLAALSENVSQFANPVLLTLHSHLPTRTCKAKVRVYWPKGRVAMGAIGPDQRLTLRRDVVEPAVKVVESELLGRFAAKPAFDTCIVDAALGTVVVPFSERTASSSAVSLPRGSRVPVPSGKLTRMFMHWCQPKGIRESSDLDLSVAFYDQTWRYLGVCSYYQLQWNVGSALVAKSAGDLQNAPWPDGATEFIDLHRDEALAAGVRYAVMVVNNYAGMPFSQLDRGFAGLMFRDDPEGWHFDPRTVELKFSIEGENGVFMPLVLDVQENVLHWIDMQARGELDMNNVETSKGAIFRVCPALMDYFSSGARASMLDLGLLHAAARASRVILRGETNRLFVRQSDEDTGAFYERLRDGVPDETGVDLPRAEGLPLMALLYRGDIELPKESSVYALFRERVAPTLAASDLLS